MGTHMKPIDCSRLVMAANDGSLEQFTKPAQTEPRRWNNGHARFDIYRAESVSLTSSLFGGGDWHWRLTSRLGIIVVDCGGYRNEADCLAAVEVLRDEAGSADVSKRF